MNLLFLSNGFGEDAVGAILIEEILKIAPGIKIKVLPLVGEGKSYKKLNDLGVEILGPVKLLPSGGFIRGPYWIMRDILAGLVFLVLKQIATLKKIKKSIDYTVAVGDIFPLYLAAKIVGKKLFFLSTAKSSLVGEHSRQEEELMKKFALAVFPRDEKTAENLRAKDIPARFLGNLMMDSLAAEPELEPKLTEVLTNGTVIGILPGSRPEAYQNLTLILEGLISLVKQTEAEHFEFVVALASTLKLEKIVKIFQDHGWFYEPSLPYLRKKGILGKLILREGKEFFKDEEISVLLTRGRFAEILKISQVVVGLAGTANEQAVGLGRPVVAFPGTGPQITLEFLKNQQKLLGGAVEIVLPRPDSVALKIKTLLANPARLEEVKKIGRERMGDPGGAPKIARDIWQIIETQNG